MTDLSSYGAPFTVMECAGLIRKMMQAGVTYIPSSTFGGYDEPASIRVAGSSEVFNLDLREEYLLRCLLEGT